MEEALTAGWLPVLLAVGAGLRVHFAPALPVALHQLLQGKLRVGRRVAPQPGGAPRGVHAARLALLPGAHGAAPAARFAHDLRAGLGGRRAQRLALRGAARAAEHDLRQRGSGEGRAEDQEAAAHGRRRHGCRLQGGAHHRGARRGVPSERRGRHVKANR